MSGAIAILGASSAIGRAIARQLAQEGHDLILAGRDLDDLARTGADCSLRTGVATKILPFDAHSFDRHAAFFECCTQALEGGLQGIVLCHGQMPDEQEAREDIEIARQMIEVNYTSVVSVLEPAASHLAERGAGFICALSSVAGDRGRPGNYLYGSTKAALSTYLGGLRARLAKHGVAVVTVKPGFVDTGLTYGLPGMFLVASPVAVASAALRAVRRDRAVVYTPWFWWGIMLIIRLLPDRIFKRLDL